jgi:hypothetical protein
MNNYEGVGIGMFQFNHLSFLTIQIKKPICFYKIFRVYYADSFIFSVQIKIKYSIISLNTNPYFLLRLRKEKVKTMISYFANDLKIYNNKYDENG